MRNRIERLRLWLLVGASLLVLVLAVFIGSARYLAHRFLFRKPAGLGADIKSAMSNFSFSHSTLNGTVYTIRAAREEEHEDGKIALHGVDMVLYGPKHDRSDRIYGDEFEYDKNSGVLRAIGIVHIDMQAGEAAGPNPAASDAHAKAAPPRAKLQEGDAKILHATTSGLIYMQKLGVAATSQPIEFQMRRMVGHAVGADYNTDSGMLMLHSAVSMTGSAQGRPVTLTASSAELDNREQLAFLTQATYSSVGESASADRATLHTRADGTLARIEAQGNVTSQAKGATVVAAAADVLLNAQSQPQSALLSGGVLYSDRQPLRQLRGQADSADIAFDRRPQPQPEHAVFTGSVHMTERTRRTDAAREPWNLRDLTASRFDAVLVPAGEGRSQIRDADASGDAHLIAVDGGSLESARGAGRTELSADDLKAHFLAGAGARPPQIDTIAGRGHTVLRQVSAAGLEQTSAGDTLDAKLRPNPSPARSAPRQISETLLNALQEGHIVVARRAPPHAAAPNAAVKPNISQDDVERAVAERAFYDGDLDRVTLTGGVQLTDQGSVVWANRLALDHRTGDARAEGSVKVDYVGQQTPARQTAPAHVPDPSHILADRADMEHATRIATFYGRPVRLWQAGGSQVQAPVLEFSQPQQRLIARCEASTGWSTTPGTPCVHTVLVSESPNTPAAAKKRATAKPVPAPAATAAAPSPAGAVRVASGGLIYSGILDQADFTGGVRIQNLDQSILAQEAIAYLHPASAPPTSAESPPAAAGPSLDGRLDRVVATGRIEVDQPGLRASGERLVYTESDRLSILTGAPARVVDASAITTGAAFRFRSDDQSVEAVGSPSGADGPGQRVHTDTHVHPSSKSGSGSR